MMRQGHWFEREGLEKMLTHCGPVGQRKRKSG